jgi:hypothetical protein
MAIHTSAIFYRRGLPNSYNNFAFVAQTNNTIIAPMNKYIKNYSFYNRQPLNTLNSSYRGALFPWRN